MINWLKIENLALIEKLEIDFNQGLNIVTGETGAGKSIIMSAVSFILGGRADKTTIRTGAKNCEITASFTVPPNLYNIINDILENAGCAFEENSNELIIKRIISFKISKTYINDKIITLSTLKVLGNILVDMHGANEHQSLIKLSVQLDLLDKYSKITNELQEYTLCYKKLKEIQERKKEFLLKLPNKVESEQLKFIIEEIDKTSPLKDEDTEIVAKHKIIANSKRIAEITMHISQTLTQNESSISDTLNKVFCEVQELVSIDNSLKPVEEQLINVIENIQEISYDVEKYFSNIELDESSFNELENRLSLLQTLKRRYGPTLEQVFATLESSNLRLMQYDNAQKMIIQLDNEEDLAIKNLREQALKISIKRKSSAKSFEKMVVKELHKLGFFKSDFKISFQEVNLGLKGFDKVDYMFCPNPGEELRLLKNIASSGEISRVMLALKTILAKSDTVPVLIFDEIDANIGGETATIVGHKLKHLGENHQILCISHLPQVASNADTHFLVQKNILNDRTFTKIIELNNELREKEIARMLGGGNAALIHSKNLLNFKNL